MGKVDFYKVLGVKRNATKDEIRSAYKKLAAKKHPDRFAGTDQFEKAEEEFKAITEAYTVLSNPAKRREHDNPHQRVRFNNNPFGSPNFGFGNINVVFETEPLEVVIQVSVMEAFSGCRKRIRYRKSSMCRTCMGTGNGTEKMSIECPNCHGGSMMFGFMSMQCPQCKGVGRIHVSGCQDCKGRGFSQDTVETEIDIPAGCPHAHVIRMMGAGNYSQFAKASGDMYVRVAIVNDDTYTINFPNIIVNVPITYKTAVLGGKAVVPSPHGKVSVTIPPGTSHGTMRRVSGKGMRTSTHSNVYGVLMVSVVIDIPKVSGDAAELLESLDSDLLVHEKVRDFEAKMDDDKG